MKSYNPNDVKYGYCGNCRQFTGAIDWWKVYARWTLGLITNGEYANYIEEQHDNDPMAEILITRLRKNPDHRQGGEGEKT